MTITIDGRVYEIQGISFGSGPSWSLIKQDGEQMNHNTFAALPSTTQRKLTELAQQHLDRMKASNTLQPSPHDVDQAAFDNGVFSASTFATAAIHPHIGSTSVGSGYAYWDVPGPGAQNSNTKNSDEVTKPAHAVNVVDANMVLGSFTSEGSVMAKRPLRTTNELNQLIESLQKIRSVVEIAEVAAIGHNGPPEPIDPSPLNIEDVDVAISIANVYRTKVSTLDEDDQYIIDACEDVFKAFGKRLGQFLRWLKRFPSKMWDATVEKSPEWVAQGLFCGAVGLIGEAVFKALGN